MADYRKIIDQLSDLETEKPNPASSQIDTLSSIEIVRLINDEDQQVAPVVATALKELSETAEIYAEKLRLGGRIFYVGAGTSGRLGVLDAAECPPTFGTKPEQIIGVISGGYATLALSMEGVEDDTDAAVNDLTAKNLSKVDMVIGLAASRRTPYTISALSYAQKRGAATAFIICNHPSEDFLKDETIHGLDKLICLPVGPEIITGSTRMKSGTAQKMALNIISTTAMVLLGKTYGNLMIDLQAKSDKLSARSRKILIDVLNIELERANSLLVDADLSVKRAIVMYKLNCSKSEADRRLAQADGSITRLFKKHQIV